MQKMKNIPIDAGSCDYTTKTIDIGSKSREIFGYQTLNTTNLHV